MLRSLANYINILHRTLLLGIWLCDADLGVTKDMSALNGAAYIMERLL